MIEQEVRHQIDRALKQKGWVLEPKSRRQNVYFESAVKRQLDSRQVQRLGSKRPDYTLFDNGQPIAIVEAKKPSTKSLKKALSQARKYAERIGNIRVMVACNGNSVKTEHFDSGKPLYIDGAEVVDFLPARVLRQFHNSNRNTLFSVPENIIEDRDQLINVFSDMNNELRAVGIRAGLERFSEFANILFLKLLSEQSPNGKEIWEELSRASLETLINYFNDITVKKLSEKYGGEVLGETKIEDPAKLRKIVHTLNSLQLSSIDEDIKGLAFEHFLKSTTDTQNDLGEYYTPRHIVRFIVQLLNPALGEKVYDPFCGTGGFLTETFRYMSGRCRATATNSKMLQCETVYGRELTTTARIAKMNMILSGDGHSGVVRGHSLKEETEGLFDTVLTNIPFSLELDEDIIAQVGDEANDADEACVLKSFNSLKDGGSMAVVVPEGFLVNKSHREFMRHLFSSARVRMIVRLPRGCFAPYTDAKTGIIYLTDKNQAQTDWFYRVDIKNDGFDRRRNPVSGINDLDETLFFLSGKSARLKNINSDEGPQISEVQIRNLEDANSFQMYQDWNISRGGHEYVLLEDVAELKNGQSITEATAILGDVPVIGGGRGTFKYFHNSANTSKRVFTLGKSGAYSGYVWWHEDPIWASDAIVVRSKDEGVFLTRFLFMCMANKQTEIYERQQGTGQPHIYITHIKDFPIPKVSIEEQHRLLENYEKSQKRLEKLERRVTEEKRRIENRINSSYY